MLPYHRTHRGRRVAASHPVTTETLDLMPEVERWRPSVPVGPDRPGADPSTGWRTDSFSVVLDRRTADELADGDPWFERGRTALWHYAMVDPRIVRAAWWADGDLLGRRLTQEGRFGPLRLRMATEVSAVVDGVVEVEEGVATVAGFEYRTLEGHLEDGWQSWQLWRWHDTGLLEHRGHTISRRGDLDNPVIALGMRVFGRGMQLLAGRMSTERLRGFVDGSVADDVDTSSAPVRGLAAVPGARLVDDSVVAS